MVVVGLTSALPTDVGSLSTERCTEQRMLQRIADVTGGQAFFPASVKALDSAYDRPSPRKPRQLT